VVFDQSVDGLTVFGGRMQIQIAAARSRRRSHHDSDHGVTLRHRHIDDAVRAAINDIRPELLFGPVP
jgi:hypothetical protein